MVSPIVLPAIRIGGKKTLKEKRAALSRPLQVLTSLKTTAFLGATLASLLNPAAAGRFALGLLPKTPKGILLTAGALPTTALVFAKSPKARAAASFLFNPFEAPKKAGVITSAIEEPRKFFSGLFGKGKDTITGLPKPTGKGAAVAAGVAGGAALVGAGVALAKSARGAIPPGLTSPDGVFQPLGPVEQPPVDTVDTVVAEAVSLPTPKMPSIRNTFKPTVNVTVKQSKSKRFINQQNLIH